MKKILSIALVSVMALGLLAGCGDSKDPTSSAEPSTDVTTPDVSSTPDEGNIENEEVDQIVVESVNARLGYIIDQARGQEDKDAFAVQTNNDSGVLDLLALTEEDVEEYAITFSMMNVHAYMVGVIKPADGKQEIVTKALTDYHTNMVKSFEQYLPDQYEIAKNASVFNEGNYVGLVMCADGDAIQTSIIDGIKNIETIIVDETLQIEEPVAPVVDEIPMEEIDTNTGSVEQPVLNIEDAGEATDVVVGSDDQMVDSGATVNSEDSINTLDEPQVNDSSSGTQIAVDEDVANNASASVTTDASGDTSITE